MQTDITIEEERKAFQTMERIGGHFAIALAVAYRKADSDNQARIRKAFPELISDYVEMVRAGHGQ